MWGKTPLLLLAVFAVTEAGRCKNRPSNLGEFRGSVTEVRRPRLCRGAGSFIGNDYWSSVGYDGVLRDGRTRSDFMTLDQDTNGYIAYWITHTKYGQIHYEAFGHAFYRDDGRLCAWFVGLHREIIETCGGFRVLSRNLYNPDEPIPFEWAQGTELTNRDTLGYHDHRIGKYVGEKGSFFGDARLRDRNFQGVIPDEGTFFETNSNDFDQKVWLLRRKTDVIPENQRLGRIDNTVPRIYSDPHYQQELTQDNRLRSFADSRSRARLYQTGVQSSDQNDQLVGGNVPHPRVYQPQDERQQVGGNVPHPRVYQPDQQDQEQAVGGNVPHPRVYEDRRAERLEKPVGENVPHPRVYEERRAESEPSVGGNVPHPRVFEDRRAERPEEPVGGNVPHPRVYEERRAESEPSVGGNVPHPRVYEDRRAERPEESVGGNVPHPRVYEERRAESGALVGGNVPHPRVYQPSNEGTEQQGWVVVGSGARPEEGQPQVGQGAAPNQGGGIGSGAVVSEEARRVPIGHGARPDEASSGTQQQGSVVGEGVRPANVDAQDPRYYTRVRPPVLVRDEYGNTYKQQVQNGRVFYYADPHVYNQQITDRNTAEAVDRRYDDEQWRRHREQLMRQDYERRLHEYHQRENLRRYDEQQQRQAQQQAELAQREQS